MPSGHPTPCPNGCYHLLNAPSLPLTENSGSNFRLPFHPRYCPNLGWLHYLFRGTIQQPNFTFLDLPPKYPCLLLQATCSQGHVIKLPLTTNSISGYNFLFFQPSHASLPQHRFFNVTETPPPSPHSVPLSSYVLLCYQTSSLPSLDPMLDHLNRVPSGIRNSLVLLSFYYHCPTKPQPWLQVILSSSQSCIVPVIWY